MSETVERASRWSRLPRWARWGLAAFVAVVVALLAIVVYRVVTRVPPIPLGETAVEALVPGSCVAESDLDLDRYTVVTCDTEHPMQVFAVADLEIDDLVYAQAAPALGRFADAVCDRYREYRLYLVAGLAKSDYEAHAIDVPTPAQYDDGDRVARCVILADDGSPLDEDLYEPMP